MGLQDPLNLVTSGSLRLGKNQGRYLGETIDISVVLDEIQTLAHAQGWRTDCFLESDPVRLFAYHRGARPGAKRLYVSAGIHGDEPAGPLAILQLLRANRWPDSIDVWVCPCLNPSGFPVN